MTSVTCPCASLYDVMPLAYGQACGAVPGDWRQTIAEACAACEAETPGMCRAECADNCRRESA